MAAGLAIGALTAVSSGTGFAALWVAIAGAGLGVAMPSVMNAALSPLTPERAGSGSSLVTAVRQVGATIGVAVLGTILSHGYTSRLDLAGLSAAAAGAVRSSVAGGVLIAHQLGSAALLHMVRTAFTGGMDVMLWTSGGIALASALLALAFLPRRLNPAAGQCGEPAAPGQPREAELQG